MDLFFLWFWGIWGCFVYFGDWMGWGVFEDFRIMEKISMKFMFIVFLIYRFLYLKMYCESERFINIFFIRIIFW